MSPGAARVLATLRKQVPPGGFWTLGPGARKTLAAVSELEAAGLVSVRPYGRELLVAHPGEAKQVRTLY